MLPYSSNYDQNIQYKFYELAKIGQCKFIYAEM